MGDWINQWKKPWEEFDSSKIYTKAEIDAVKKELQLLERLDLIERRLRGGGRNGYAVDAEFIRSKLVNLREIIPKTS